MRNVRASSLERNYRQLDLIIWVDTAAADLFRTVVFRRTHPLLVVAAAAYSDANHIVPDMNCSHNLEQSQRVSLINKRALLDLYKSLPKTQDLTIADLISATPDLTSVLLYSLLKQNGGITLVHIGAHIGDTNNDPVFSFLRETFETAGSQAKCTAILVEPVRHLFEKLKHNCRDMPGVIVENTAIAPFNGIVEFFHLKEGVNPELGGFPAWFDQLGSLNSNRILEPDIPRDSRAMAFLTENTISTEVPCVTVKHLLAKHKISAVDFLGMDVEGSEIQILQSMFADQIRPSFLFFESALLTHGKVEAISLLHANSYSLVDMEFDMLAMLDFFPDKTIEQLQIHPAMP